MFLNKDDPKNDINRQKQEEISLQWDNIERDLHDDSLWYFLSNYSKIQYKTRIDLILNLISEKTEDEKEEYYTFFYFDNCKELQSLENIWREIQHTFLILKDWFENHEFYHKIGYLIASETTTLQNVFNLSRKITKDQFNNKLDQLIRSSIANKENFAELSYEKSSEYKKISNLLLLFNVISVQKNGEQTQWFPFDNYKFVGKDKFNWSLEHLHAQESEGMKSESTWKEWLKLHKPSISTIGGNEELLAEMKSAMQQQRLDGRYFEEIREKVVEELSVKGNTEYMHSISNLALLNTSDNAALNNSTFDVKRNAIIEMDKNGQYVPFCTKMVFLKYYTPSKDNQLYFWGEQDRIAYISAINNVLKDYLEEDIITEIGGSLSEN